MTESDKEALLRAGVKFMDITDYPELHVSARTAAWQPCKKNNNNNDNIVSYGGGGHDGDF